MKKRPLLFGIIIIVIIGLAALFFYNVSKEPGRCLKENDTDVCYSRFLQLGINAYASEQYQESVKYFKLSAASFDDDLLQGFGAWRNLANAYMSLDQFDQAQAIYDQLLEVKNHPEVPMIYLDYLRLYDRAKELDAGLELTDLAYQKYGDIIFLYKKAGILEDLERYSEEVAIYEVLLEADPDNHESIQFKINRLKQVHNLE
jgi:tetratricopeptide (TPR) repeat protein